MDIAALIKGFQGQQPAARQHVGLSPEVLLKEGILSNPEKPTQALRRARGLVQQGHYKEARELVCLHARTADLATRAAVTELLATCAMRGAGGDWELLLRSAEQTYQAIQDTTGVARIHRDLGEMLVQVGRLDEASQYLKSATLSFQALGERTHVAEVQCLEARAALRAGQVGLALTHVDSAIQLFVAEGQGRGLALARLERATILARQGESSAAARDLLAAERFLASSGGAFDRLRARLARAECLYLLGDTHRAAQGLKRVLIDVVDLEEIPTRAFVHTLLGQACMDSDPSSARQFLMRGRHLYQSVHIDYHVAMCDVALARVEHRIGLDPRSRLKQLADRNLASWPLLAAEMAMARAETNGVREPERARQVVLGARSFAKQANDASLVRMLDKVLLTSGLATHDEMRTLTPMPSRTSQPVVHSGISESQPTVRAPRPEPFHISDVSSDHGVVITDRNGRGVRFTKPEHAAPALAIQAPQAVGIRRRA